MFKTIKYFTFFFDGNICRHKCIGYALRNTCQNIFQWFMLFVGLSIIRSDENINKACVSLVLPQIKNITVQFVVLH